MDPFQFVLMHQEGAGLALVAQPRVGARLRQIHKEATALFENKNVKKMDCRFRGIDLCLRPGISLQGLRRYWGKAKAVRNAYILAKIEAESADLPPSQENNDRKRLRCEEKNYLCDVLERTDFDLKIPGAWDAALDQATGSFQRKALWLAKRWGKVIQHEMIAHGKGIAEAAETSMDVVDDPCLKGDHFMVAALYLTHIWKHGDALKPWVQAFFGPDLAPPPKAFTPRRTPAAQMVA